MILFYIGVIGCLIMMYYVVYGLWVRRKSPQEVNDYFSSYRSSNSPVTETEQCIIEMINDIFFGGKRVGQIKGNMKISDLYEMVAGRYMDDMEVETLVTDIETNWGYKLPQDYQFSSITISELAWMIDSHKESAANESVT